jgi:hypothetical protein
MERENIIILDYGIDVDRLIGPLGCCAGTFAPVRA